MPATTETIAPPAPAPLIWTAEQVKEARHDAASQTYIHLLALEAAIHKAQPRPWEN
jgi:hypothetical protein